MARKVNTSKNKTRPKNKNRRDYTAETLRKLKQHEEKSNG